MKRRSSPNPKPKTFHEYLAALPASQRAALEKLRKAIHSAAPNLEEDLSYGLPSFRLDGKYLFSLGAAANHCALYLGSTATTHQDELRGYDLSHKGTIRFRPDCPPSAALVRKLVKARIAEKAAPSKTTRKTPPLKTSGPTPLAPDTPRSDAGQNDHAVGEFLGQLDHPLAREFAEVRRIILSVSPEIRDGIKWNSLSFRTTDWFATVNLRAKDQVQLVFHLGAKTKTLPPRGLPIDDPADLIKWLAKDRGLITLGAGKEIAVRRAAFEAVVRAWIRNL